MSVATDLKKTALFPAHQALGAKIVPFVGWAMPVQYREGILAEHLQTRRSGGLFDVSHMGRFWLTGRGVLPFLQNLLTHNIAELEPGRCQYNLIAYPDGGTVDDAYLYMLAPESYLLVVNAANIDKDFAHIEALRRAGFAETVTLEDRTAEISMLALQGPRTEEALARVIDELGLEGELTTPGRNSLARFEWEGEQVIITRTGYTGEPVCFEIFVPSPRAGRFWDALLATDGMVGPVGLGARDTLRSEAGLPLYGDELSQTISGLAGGVHSLAIRMVDTPSTFVGRDGLLNEYLSLEGPRIYRFLIEGRGRTPRLGDRVFYGGEDIGHVTSAVVVPYWKRGAEGARTDEQGIRRVGFALLSRPMRIGLHRGGDRRFGDEIEIRRCADEGKEMMIGSAEVVMEFAIPSPDRTELIPVFYPLKEPVEDLRALAGAFVRGASDNHAWRQRHCINLIPSENTPSAFVRWASELDPSGRYAEHQKAGFEELYYYQGCDWIQAVEEKLHREMRLIFGCANVETRPISGQMANETVFEAMVRFASWKRRKEDPGIRRLHRVFNNHLALGGHLSSQPSGALYNYVELDEKGDACVTHLPLQKDYPYAADAEALQALIEAQRPDLIIFGKSMVIEPEPIAAAREVIDSMHPEQRPVIMYDMAHVLGLYGPLFQEPFAEGADIVTGSTHKTFFGPQRGVVLTDIDETYGRRRFLLDFIRKAAFPGATSNHHLGTLQALLAAAYEFRAFGRAYQEAIHTNARALARALVDAGLTVPGDPERGYTQTHQVLVDVGAGKGREVARRLEENNIICNFQGLPGDASFKVSRGLRLGVSEMTRFGMKPDGFAELAGLMADCIVRDKDVRDEVVELRGRFLEMQFCFGDLDLE